MDNLGFWSLVGIFCGCCPCIW